MTSSLVGSEMCIRDRSSWKVATFSKIHPHDPCSSGMLLKEGPCIGYSFSCLLYTSDAADDM
eukprot:3061235-Prorocentrum_lima.AAC.1